MDRKGDLRWEGRRIQIEKKKMRKVGDDGGLRLGMGSSAGWG
jgi:hypothetical protein